MASNPAGTSCLVFSNKPPIEKQTSDEDDDDLFELGGHLPKTKFDFLPKTEKLPTMTKNQLLYNMRNEYIETMKKCLDLETTEDNIMLHES
uniref:Uncharacterized protein n=1 Tax=Romanomermis culicivorax TaxID=13658 RepID=A0A915JVN5_ROMCU